MLRDAREKAKNQLLWQKNGSNCAVFVGFPGGASGKESASQYRRCKRLEFDPWVGRSTGV